MQKTHEKRAKELLGITLSLGGVLIKLSQFLSSRRDIFPTPYIEILSRLQDSVPPVGFDRIKGLLAQEYGDYKRIFSSFDQIPLASASLGQVHRARLHNGKEVVCKLLKPDIEKIIDTDFAILDMVFNFLANFKVFNQLADFSCLFEEFVTVIGDELNFNREIYILKSFKTHFSNYSYVVIPHVYDDLCTKRIIVMDYHKGDKINEVDKWIKRNNDPAIIVDRLVEIYWQQLLSTKMVHFDPHPGNILVSNNNRIILLDFGMAGTISEHMRRGIRTGIKAIINKDSQLLIDVLESQGFLRKGAERQAIVPVIEFFFREVCDHIRWDREYWQSLDLSPIVDRLVQIIYTQPFRLPTNWAFVGKTIGGLSGIVATLNPDFDALGMLKSYGDKYFQESYQNQLEYVAQKIVKNINTIGTLPGRVEGFIRNIETGNYTFKNDHNDLINAISDFKGFLIKIACFMMFVFSGVGAYISYILGYQNIGIFLIIVATMHLIGAGFYRTDLKKRKIYRYFS